MSPVHSDRVVEPQEVRHRGTAKLRPRGCRVPTNIYVGLHDAAMGVDVVSVEVGTVAGTLLRDPKGTRRRVVPLSAGRDMGDPRQLLPLVEVGTLRPQINRDRGTSVEMISVPIGRTVPERITRSSSFRSSVRLVRALCEALVRLPRIPGRIVSSARRIGGRPARIAGATGRLRVLVRPASRER